ncbi:MAG: MarR family winged helix-turn-helix transcriptional regulator [Acidobacteriota bacterium]
MNVGRRDPGMKKDKDRGMMRELAQFRYTLRRFLRFSEKAARACGVTPQQHQLMLGIAGFTEEGRATISDLAEFLQERNNSVVGLVERAVESGLVKRQESKTDRRQVIVTLTPRGEEILSTLSHLHHDEMRRVRAGFVSVQGPGKRSAADRKSG